MKTKHLCLLGLLFFLISYLFFSKILPNFQKPIDFAHWFNLIGACLLLSFNDVFPKSEWSFVASIVTFLGVVGHIGLCTIDFIMSSFGNDEIAKEALSHQISNSAEIFYPFVAIGPSLLFIGLTLHALRFVKTDFVIVLLIILSSASIGFSFFVLKDGIYMFLSCLVFVFGLGFLLCRNDIKKVK
ncbi:hypothetical protein BD847_1368 [Flavobacterium cutihirudinis]|uniref:Uncharacterized protein n=1 Tax=Flavobacterium cutihirudinis TaxID=1265740 RepID=A0A3D9FV19_9FLAO|nr:hypothetical protein [Flavobacterium cutihirudinis]RED24635.1 hypothetical protein BD847_1368 [Flavobacterium cutihirudinis]